MSEINTLRPNRLWTAPPRRAVDRVEVERTRQEIANDPALLEAARSFRVTPEMRRELAKYDRRPISPYLLTMVLP